MLNTEEVVKEMKKYGFTSTSSHPYLFNRKDQVGICYSFDDDNYGKLERIKIFDKIEDVSEFLKSLVWYEQFGKKYNIKIALSDYNIEDPNVIFVRNGQTLVGNDLLYADKLDSIYVQEKEMPLESRLVLEAGYLLLLFEYIKNQQNNFSKKLFDENIELKHRYFELQKAVDIFNKNKVNRLMSTDPTFIPDQSFDVMTETSVKDRYNSYKTNVPSLNDVNALLSDTWELLHSIELNQKYFEDLANDKKVKNELKVVDEKNKLITKINERALSIGTVNLCDRFQKINKKYKHYVELLPDDFVDKKTKAIEYKYSVYSKLDKTNLSKYLKSSLYCSNYDELARVYSIPNNSGASLPFNEVATDLFNQFKNDLTPLEQSVLVLYNSEYSVIFDALLEIDNLQSLELKNVIKILEKIKGFSKVKSICFNSVKKKLLDPVNENIKKQLFLNIDYTSFETFVKSLISLTTVLKGITKISLNGDLKLYYKCSKKDNLEDRRYLCLVDNVSNCLNDLSKKEMIYEFKLKSGLEILYSPYRLDIGEVYGKHDSEAMAIKERNSFSVLVNLDKADILKAFDEVFVSFYEMNSKNVDDINVINDLDLKRCVTFLNVALVRKEEKKNV